jgi:hypothetical protein
MDILKKLNLQFSGKLENGVITITITIYGIPITLNVTIDELLALLDNLKKKG